MQEDLDRLLKLMKPIKYGWVGYDGEKHEKIGKKFAEEYRLQLSSDILSTKMGVCWDQVEYEAWVLGDTCEFKRIAFVYYGEKNLPSHTFAVIHEGDDWFWFEHAWGNKAGVYRFDSLEDLLKEVMKEFCSNGGAIFFSTHVLEVAEKLCNKIAIIKQGKLVVSGNMEEITKNSSLEDVFLELSNHA